MFEQIKKKISYLENYRKLQGFEQPYSQAIFATAQNSSRFPATGLRFSKIWIFLYRFFLKIFEKIPKTSYYENYTDLSSHIWRQNSQQLNVPSQYPTTGLRSSRFWNLIKSKFFFQVQSRN